MRGLLVALTLLLSAHTVVAMAASTTVRFLWNNADRTCRSISLVFATREAEEIPVGPSDSLYIYTPRDHADLEDLSAVAVNWESETRQYKIEEDSFSKRLVEDGVQLNMLLD